MPPVVQGVFAPLRRILALFGPRECPVPAGDVVLARRRWLSGQRHDRSEIRAMPGLRRRAGARPPVGA